MKFISAMIAALTIVSCGTETVKPQNNSQEQKQELVEVKNSELPKAIVLVTDAETKEVKAYSFDESLLNGKSFENLTEAEKTAIAASLEGAEISTTLQKDTFSLNDLEISVPENSSVQWFVGGFYGYGFGYRFRYGFGFGYPFGGFNYGFYRPFFGYGFGYPYFW